MWKRPIFGAGIHKNAPKSGDGDGESSTGMHPLQTDGEHGAASEHPELKEDRGGVEGKPRKAKGAKKRVYRRRKPRVQGSRQEGRIILLLEQLLDITERIAYQTSGSALEIEVYLKGVKKDAATARNKISRQTNGQGASEAGIQGEQGDRGQESQDGEYQ